MAMALAEEDGHPIDVGLRPRMEGCADIAGVPGLVRSEGSARWVLLAFQLLLEQGQVGGKLLADGLTDDRPDQLADAMALELDSVVDMGAGAGIGGSEGERHLRAKGAVDTSDAPASARLAVRDFPPEGARAAWNPPHLMALDTHRGRGAGWFERGHIH